MSVKAKLFILFLFSSLIPFLLIGFINFEQAENAIINRIHNQLQATADLQEKRINEILQRYLENVKTITSQKDFKQNIANYIEQREESQKEKIESNISDFKQAIPDIENVSIILESGETIFTTATTPLTISENKDIFIEGKNTQKLYEVYKDKDNLVKNRLIGPITFNQKTIAVIVATIDSTKIEGITQDYTGQGATGEALLVQKNQAGDAVFLTPLRFDAGAALTRAIPKGKTNIPAIPAISGQEGILTSEDIIDYRGKQVFAVTRYIEALEWGIVVKIDQSEALEPINQLARTFIIITTIFSLISVITSFLISQTITKPIKKLSEYAKKIEEGDFSSEITITQKGEIGFLAKAFKQMSKNLAGLYTGLEKKVKERTLDLEEAKIKIETMLLSIGESLVAIDKEGTIILANKKFQELTGWKKGSIIGKKIATVAPLHDSEKKLIPEKKRLIIKMVNKNKKKQYSISSRSYHIQKKNKQIIPIELTAAPIIVNGKTIGAIEIMKDITNEKQLEKIKSEFVSLASHQLRTPLTATSWFIELLNEEKLTKKQKKYLGEIEQSNDRMIKLVNALLNTSRLEMKTLKVNPKKIDIKDIALETIAEEKINIEKKKLKITTNIKDKLPTFTADPDLIKIIIQNLLTNAIKYSKEKGKILLTIKTDSTKKNIIINVEDNGIGIPKEQHSKIFSKLFRASNAEGKNTDGNGLGLYIIKTIIENSGGKISFKSQENKGTTFTVKIPTKGMKKKKGSKKLT